MADNALLFKYLAKCVGMKHGIMPTFMAKPWGDVSRFDHHLMMLLICAFSTASRLLRVSLPYSCIDHH